jgi:hypothetical protein
MIEKTEKNTKLTQEKKENLLAKLEALQDTIKEKLKNSSISEETELESLLDSVQ